MDPYQRTRKTYDRIAGDFHESRKRREALEPHFATFAAAVPHGLPVLDVGCGPGWALPELRKNRLQAVAMDYSDAMLRIAAKEHPESCVQADMCALPFRDASFGGLWVCASLLHLSRDDACVALREFRRVLTGAGALHVSVKSNHSDGYDEKYGPDAPRWYTGWTDEALDTMAGRAGFGVLDSSTVSSGETTWLFRLFRTTD